MGIAIRRNPAAYHGQGLSESPWRQEVRILVDSIRRRVRNATDSESPLRMGVLVCLRLLRFDG